MNFFEILEKVNVVYIIKRKYINAWMNYMS